MALGALAVWSIPGLIQAGQEIYYASLTGKPYGSLWRLVATMVPRWWLWALAMPLVMRLARRWRPTARSWYRVIPLHVLLALLFETVIIFLIIQWGLHVRIWGQPLPFRGQVNFALWSMIPYVHFMAYWTICGLTWIFDGEKRIRQRDLDAARLESELRGAQLDALRRQLRPHFLFNTLNTASVLMEDDVAGARTVLSRLGDLLRQSLDDGGRDLVTVGEEVEILDRYLDIERIRFQDRLIATVTVKPECAGLLVPVMILQPLVENAIRHGIAARPGPGRVAVSVAKEQERLVVVVADDGVGVTPDHAERVGLGNTRARLAQIYGPDHAFEIAPVVTGGTLVRLSLPAWEEGHERA